MRDLHLIRRYELVFVLSTAVIYVVRRLIEEINRINGMVEIAESNRVSSSLVWRNLAAYNHTLNNNVPLIVGVCLFLGAWYMLSNQAILLVNDRNNDRKAVLSVALTSGLLLASTFIYHYFKLQARYQHDGVGHIIGLKVFSFYSKRTVLADAIGLGIFLIAYQLFFQLFNYLHQNLATELPKQQKRISYLPFTGLIAMLISLALALDLPPTLWRGDARTVLLVMGLGVQILLIQRYFYVYILPLFKTSSTSEVVLASRIATFLLMILCTTLILWGASTGFHYNNRNPALLMFIVLVGSTSSAFLRQAIQKEKTVLQTQVSTKSAELSSLRAQINPHFLFNSLNSLYATALRENSEKTADGIQKLGDMMRFMLQENNRDRIPLNKEIEYLRNYIQIQRMRIDETHPVEIRVNIQEPNRAIYLAPMMLTPFVENAFKHGISLRHPSWIYITLTLDDTRLYFKVHNSQHSKPTEPADRLDRHDPEDQPGVGLDNVRKRLDLIYPGRHQLDSQQSEQDYFVSLTLVYW